MANFAAPVNDDHHVLVVRDLKSTGTEKREHVSGLGESMKSTHLLEMLQNCKTCFLMVGLFMVDMFLSEPRNHHKIRHEFAPDVVGGPGGRAPG